MQKKLPSLLSGFRVLDLTTEMGAFCGKLLGDLGMDVIKVEPPCGDPLRAEPPFATEQVHHEGSLRFAYLNSGKRGITLDLTKPTGKALCLELVARSDVVLESYEPGLLEKLGLAFSALCERQPKLILVSISGFGQSGPYRNYLAPDLVTTAMGGLLYFSGDPEYPPCMPPESQSYYYGSLYAAYGVVLALWRRESRGSGAHIDASIQASLALHEHIAFTYSTEGKFMKRAGSQHQHVAPANLFLCKDGYISIFVTQRHWPAFLEFWEDHPAELDDPRLVDNGERHAQAHRINSLVSSFTSKFTKEDLALRLQERGIPALPVNTPTQFMADPHVRDRGFFGSVTHSVLGTYEQANAPFIVNGERTQAAPAPMLGQHNKEVYCGELGFDVATLEVMASDGVV